MWSGARGALASRLMGSFWPDPKTGAQIRSRGGYSLVLNGVAVGFCASAQCLAVVSAALSRSGPWEGRESAGLLQPQSCSRHRRPKWRGAVEQESCSGCPGKRQHSTSAAFFGWTGRESSPARCPFVLPTDAACPTDEISKPLHPHPRMWRQRTLI